jgi:hypothetical protein
MANHQRFSINGIKVKGVPVGNGMYLGIPEDLSLADVIQAMLTGKVGESIAKLAQAVGQGELDIQLLEDEVPTRASTKTQSGRETVREYLTRTGTSKRGLALNYSCDPKTVTNWLDRDFMEFVAR